MTHRFPAQDHVVSRNAPGALLRHTVSSDRPPTHEKAYRVVLAQREEQFRHIRTAFEDCREQLRGHAALITGAVGSGKTTLLEALTDDLSDEVAQVLRAVASEAERDIPFGVIGQLLHGAYLPEQARQKVRDLLPEHTDVARLSGRPSAVGRISPVEQAPVLSRLFSTLSDLARRGPIVLAVDDVQHADSASLQCLLYVIRRLRYSPMLVLMTEAPMLRLPHPQFRAELLSQPHSSRITLEPLTQDSLALLASAHPGTTDARRTAERVIAVTGGSPLLARALMDELPARHAEADGTPPSRGGLFDQAVLGCLYRHEPQVRQVAQALAVLGRATTVDVLAAMLGTTHESALRALHLLRVSGLVEGYELRHPRIARSVLGDLTAEHRRVLHSRAAEVLRYQEAGSNVLAGHLIAADWVEGSWAAPTLQEAAVHALASGRPEFAGACLRQAWRAETDEEQRAGIEALMLTARWQTNPLSAETYLPDLLETIRERGTSLPRVVSVLPPLLWQGRVGEADDLLAQLELDEGQDTEDAAELRVLHLLVSLCRSEVLADAHCTDGMYSGASGTPVVSQRLEAVTVLHQALTSNPYCDVVSRSEQILRRHDGRTGAPGLPAGALLAMLYAGRPDRVVAWTDTVLDEAGVRYAPVWQAVLEAIRGEALLRLGDLGRAEQCARSALELITPQGWGVVVAGPLGTLITCAAESGRHHEADMWLALPTPVGMFQTPLGLHYLAARGRYHLAAGQPDAACEDFRQCADLMEKWRLDIAGLVPWRLELARAQLRLDRRAEAARLVQEELSGDRRIDRRTRGRGLRLLARTVAPEQRKRLLSEAVDLLQACGDKVELARALRDLGTVVQQLPGDPGQAQLLMRRAYQLARESGAQSLANRLAPGGCVAESEPERDVPQSGYGLSKAELRVAALASLGHTNRQISTALFITVSTVEQHLTRVYRKLGVKRRADLPAELSVYAEDVGEMPRGDGHGF
ncbi:helix-turn-helix transcriptional regulator [Streptomyces venetus]|uniref:helix-turn-helix transcriptional regulator n=1 Tax=Streptomyces venetus TaxID=1701086 RepID=UPI003C2B5DB9